MIYTWVGTPHLLLQDIIEDVTEDAEDGTRKKRWAMGGAWDAVGGGDGGGGGWDTEPDILTFISEGGPDHLYQTLPHIIKPLMVSVTVLILIIMCIQVPYHLYQASLVGKEEVIER